MHIEHLLHLLWPDHLIVRGMLLFMGVYFVYSLYCLWRRSPTVPPPSSTTSGSPKEPFLNNSQWERNYASRVRQQIQLIADRQQSDWKAVLDINRSIVMQSIERMRATANILLLLGLATTIAGLAPSVFQLRDNLIPLLRTGDLLGMESNLRQAFSQIGSSFSGTFWGVLSALLYNMFYTKRRAFVKHRLDARDELLLQELRNILPPSPGAYLMDLQKVADQIRAVMDDIKIIIQDFGPTMNSAADTFKQALKEAGSVVTDSIQSLQQESSNIRESLQGAANQLNTAVEKVTDVSSSISTAVQKLSNAHKELLNAVSSQFDMWKKHLETVLGTTNQLREDYREQAMQILGQLSALNQSVRDNIVNLNQTNASFATAKTDLASLLQKHYQDAADDVKNALMQAKEYMGQMNNAFQKLGSSSDEILARIDLTTAEIVRVAGQITNAADSVRSNLQESVDVLSKAFAELEQMSRSVQQASSAFEQRSSQSADQFEKSVSEFANNLDVLSKAFAELEQMSRSVQQASSAFEQRSSQSADQFEKSVSEFANNLERLAETAKEQNLRLTKSARNRRTNHDGYWQVRRSRLAKKRGGSRAAQQTNEPQGELPST